MVPEDFFSLLKLSCVSENGQSIRCRRTHDATMLLPDGASGRRRSRTSPESLLTMVYSPGVIASAYSLYCVIRGMLREFLVFDRTKISSSSDGTRSVSVWNVASIVSEEVEFEGQMPPSYRLSGSVSCL